MRILILNDAFVPSNGPARILYRLAKEWINKGHSVAIITLKNKFEHTPDLPIEEVETKESPSFLLSIGKALRVRRQLKNRIDEEYPDIIISGGPILALLTPGKHPLVYRLGGIYPEELTCNFRHGLRGGLKAILKYIQTFLAIQKSKMLISPSQFAAKANSKCFLKKASPIYNAVDGTVFNPEGKTLDLGERSLLFVGEIRARKGIDFLIKSFRAIEQRAPGTKLYIIGKSSHPKLLDSVQANEKNEKIVYLGTKDNVDEYMRGCDVFVFPSYAESFGLVICEAQACGKPIVAFNTTAVPEVVEDNFSGFLVKKNDLDTFVDKVCLLLENDELRENMGRNAKQFMGKFNWEKSAEEYIELFRTIKDGCKFR
ncbi:MAG: glycosyltransferase family 4 protein [Chloroflexota bacterium]